MGVSGVTSSVMAASWSTVVRYLNVALAQTTSQMITASTASRE
jgi:hypothetical protein